MFSKQFQILNKFLHLGEEVIIEEDVVGRASCNNLQSYTYILELKMEMLPQYVKEVEDIRVPLLKMVLKYEDFVR